MASEERDHLSARVAGGGPPTNYRGGSYAN